MRTHMNLNPTPGTCGIMEHENTYRRTKVVGTLRHLGRKIALMDYHKTIWTLIMFSISNKKLENLK